MKLAFVCTEKLPSPSIRGGAIQIMIDGVAPYLAKSHELTIISITDPSLPKRETRDGIRFVRVPKENYPEHVSDVLKNQVFDVIHVFNRPKDIIKYKIAAPESSLVLSLHNEMFAPEKISESQGKYVIRSIARIMTVSSYIKETVIDRFPQAAGKIDVVYSGADLDRYTPIWTAKGQAVRGRLRKRYQIENKKVVLFVGRLSRSKGPHMLIKAMKYLKEIHPDAVLVIVGGKWFNDDGTDAYIHYLHRIAAPFGKQILFTKYVPSDQIPDLFLIADAFVCSSQWQEPLARVHYEAMAAGVPVITTNRGGNAEVIRNGYNGLVLSDYNRVGAFVQAIDFLLSNGYTASVLARNGRAVVEASHHFHHVADRLEVVYRKAADSYERRRRTIYI